MQTLPGELVRVGIIGCGVIGATIAYELSQLPWAAVTVLDRGQPAGAATGAALGVLIGISSHKLKGRAMNLRLESMRRYETLIPELESLTGDVIPVNRRGIVHFCLDAAELPKWRQLADFRRRQGWRLDLLDRAAVQQRYPWIKHPRLVGAVESPDDRQIDPTALTQALVKAARQQGATFQFGVEVTAVHLGDGRSPHRLSTMSIHPSENQPRDQQDFDWLVLASGLGSTRLTAPLVQPVMIRPVLGQAARIRLAPPLGAPEPQPVMTGEDIHIVPLSTPETQGEYWVGATVEFPEAAAMTMDWRPDPDRWQAVWQGAIALCPALAKAAILHTWSGLRPRPEAQAAPILGPMAGADRVLLATGHYRNGILLAPATALAIRRWLTSAIGG